MKKPLLIAAAVSAAVLSAPLAGAWPIPFTGEEQRMIAAGHNAGFPGDDDQVYMAGRQACQLLYTGHNRQQVVDELSGRYGATPEQTSALVGAARGTICTQAPG